MPVDFVLSVRHLSFRNVHGVKKVKKHIAVCATSTAPLQELACHMGSQCYLPPGRGDIPAFTPAN